MEVLLDLLSWIALALGGFFYAVGGIGIVRMPDVFTRMHAASVSETLGTGLLVLGMVLQAGFTLVAAKLLIIFFMLMIVAPVSSHALARAALHEGRLPLLVNAKNWLVETDPVSLFPELETRLRQPLSSEQVAGETDPQEGTLPARPTGGYAYALEGDGAPSDDGEAPR
ncbi:MAG TPA: monovalent cation/H(+) antiporter subunit G [Thermohalobaculum sp.]|nr:monovalent cation/H(+) antiporter subunit G [Thermohalobaculum sp.]